MAGFSEKQIAEDKVTATTGETFSIDCLVTRLYDNLRTLAHRKMRTEAPGHTLQATALVHEAYMRLLHNGAVDWNSPAHFYCAAAEAMRRILVERARRRSRLRHGGGLARVTLDEDAISVSIASPEILALHRALDQFEKIHTRKAKVVKLRYFVGFSIAETAELLGLSIDTVKMDWAYARAWLKRGVSNIVID